MTPPPDARCTCTHAASDHRDGLCRVIDRDGNPCECVVLTIPGAVSVQPPGDSAPITIAALLAEVSRRPDVTRDTTGRPLELMNAHALLAELAHLLRAQVPMQLGADLARDVLTAQIGARNALMVLGGIKHGDAVAFPVALDLLSEALAALSRIAAAIGVKP
jgi:hypothetical protein